jgi:esterase/lipase superfamily enzyme
MKGRLLLFSKTLLILLVILSNSMLAFSKTKKQAMRHLYIEWKGQEQSIILGSFASNDKTRIPYLAKNIKDITESDIENWLGQHNQSATLLFHAMWGQQKSFHKNFIRSIDKAIDVASSEKHDIISFLWHAGGVMYRSNWNSAFSKGEPLAPVLTWVARHYTRNVDVFCHSMGNRFFEGIVSNMEASKYFRSLTFFSADIGNASTDLAFQKCLQTAHASYVYIHKKDRLLLASDFLHGECRLGRTGPLPASSTVTVVDMTKMTNSFSNHSNFSKKWVTEKLHEQWNLQDQVSATM